MPLTRETAQDTASHLELFKEVLDEFELALDKCVTFVGDHVSVNKSVAREVSVPLVGCLSHRLDFVVKQYLHKKNDPPVP